MAQYLKQLSSYIFIPIFLSCLCVATFSFSKEISQASLHGDIKLIID